MKKLSIGGWMVAGLLGFASLGLSVRPALAHHSFAMYDQTKTLTLTGVASSSWLRPTMPNCTFM